jgi:hypothetical protein
MSTNKIVPNSAASWESLKIPAFSLSLGLVLLAVVLLTPDAGAHQFGTMLRVARSSPWERWCDWRAAWCSLKIVLLGMAGFCILMPPAMVLARRERHLLARLVTWLALSQSLVQGFGLYYFVKAVF